jgi:hypothetical protein
MHVSLKQIQMLTTFDKYNLLLSIYVCVCIYMLKYVIKEINLLFFKCVQMFHHKSKGKGRKGDSSSPSQARLGTSTDLFAVMVLLNFYLHVLIYYYFTASFDIFYHDFYLHDTLASRHRQAAFLEALNNEDQQQMARAWSDVRAAQQEALEEPEDIATQHEAPKESDVEDKADDQPEVTYMLV